MDELGNEIEEDRDVNTLTDERGRKSDSRFYILLVLLTIENIFMFLL